MSEPETDDAESAQGWTTANILKLIGCMRKSLPKREESRSCRAGLSAVPWEKVAFPPFSPDECREKWRSVMEKMRKCRSVPELIAEAEEAISDPLWHKKIHPELPKRPAPPKKAYMLKNYSRLKKKHPGLAMTKITSMAFKMYDELPDDEKAKYERRQELRCKQYKRRMQDFCRDNNIAFDPTSKRKTKIIKKKRVRLPKKTLKMPGEPKVPSQNGFTYFTKDQMKLLKENISNHPDRLAEAKKLWDKLPTKEKESYKQQILKNMEQYSKDLQTWFKTLTPEKQTEYLKQNPGTLKFLDATNQTDDREELLWCEPSDSEDEDIAVLSSEEEPVWTSYEEEEEDDGQMFETYF